MTTTLPNRTRRTRGDVGFAVFMLGLALLTLILWLADPSHDPGGRSRVDWPEPQTARP